MWFTTIRGIQFIRRTEICLVLLMVIYQKYICPKLYLFECSYPENLFIIKMIFFQNISNANHREKVRLGYVWFLIILEKKKFFLDYAISGKSKFELLTGNL